jgi:hypothetical protein
MRREARFAITRLKYPKGWWCSMLCMTFNGHKRLILPAGGTARQENAGRVLLK